MAEKIYNIGDYRRQGQQDPPGMNTETIESINIEDPLNFLDASEKEAYIRERSREEAEKEKTLREREHAASAAARALPEEERSRLKQETDDPLGDRPVRRGPDPADAPRRREQVSRPEHRRRETVPDWEPEEDDDEDEGNGIIIASAILGIVIMLAAVFLGWMAFFAPQPEEPEAEERAIQEAQAQEEKGQDEEDETDEEDASDYALIPEGFELCDDTVTTTTTLNMRSEPDTDSDNKVTSVPEGTKLERVAVNRSSGWSAVYVSGFDEVLYCSNKYLKEE